MKSENIKGVLNTVSNINVTISRITPKKIKFFSDFFDIKNPLIRIANHIAPFWNVMRYDIVPGFMPKNKATGPTIMKVIVTILPVKKYDK